MLFDIIHYLLVTSCNYSGSNKNLMDKSSYFGSRVNIMSLSTSRIHEEYRVSYYVSVSYHIQNLPQSSYGCHSVYTRMNHHPINLLSRVIAPFVNVSIQTYQKTSFSLTFTHERGMPLMSMIALSNHNFIFNTSRLDMRCHEMSIKSAHNSKIVFAHSRNGALK